MIAFAEQGKLLEVLPSARTCVGDSTTLLTVYPVPSLTQKLLLPPPALRQTGTLVVPTRGRARPLPLPVLGLVLLVSSLRALVTDSVFPAVDIA